MKPLSGRRVRVLIDHRLQALTPLFQQAPPDHAQPLMLAGRAAGWVSLPARQAIKHCAGVSIDHDTTHVGVPDQSGSPSLQGVLHHVAETLREAGCLKAWRNEQIDIMAEGNCLGTLERAAMRPLGLRTRAVHLNAWSADGRLWVARRSLAKPTNPGCWDTAVGGLVSAGESHQLALMRESQEEAGLEVNQLDVLKPLRNIVRVSRRIPEGYQVEDILVADYE